MDPEELIARIERAMAEIGPKLPDLDRGDLALILQYIIQPIGTGKIFLLRERDGRLVF